MKMKVDSQENHPSIQGLTENLVYFITLSYSILFRFSAKLEITLKIPFSQPVNDAKYVNTKLFRQILVPRFSEITNKITYCNSGCELL